MIRYGVIVTTVSLPILYYYLTFDHSFSSRNEILDTIRENIKQNNN